VPPLCSFRFTVHISMTNACMRINAYVGTRPVQKNYVSISESKCQNKVSPSRKHISTSIRTQTCYLNLSMASKIITANYAFHKSQIKMDHTFQIKFVSQGKLGFRTNKVPCFSIKTFRPFFFFFCSYIIAN
jgi:hypothetical protein